MKSSKGLNDLKLPESKEPSIPIKVKKILPLEPSQNDTNSTLILFRFPDGVSRKERRFN